MKSSVPAEQLPLPGWNPHWLFWWKMGVNAINWLGWMAKVTQAKIKTSLSNLSHG
jgi:hypothetical protein